MTDLVIMKDRQAVTTSLQVADNFEKQHKDVFRSN
jgi:phage regulator Rha-like protein